MLVPVPWPGHEPGPLVVLVLELVFSLPIYVLKVEQLSLLEDCSQRFRDYGISSRGECE